jgi:NitT/TauT family transport system substrate-binding protein
MVCRHPFVRNYLPMRNADFSSRVLQTASAHNQNNGVDCGRRLVILAALLFVAGCGEVRVSPAAREMRIAINPWPGYSFMYLAEEQGYFRDEGLTVRLVELASLADARRVFEQRQSDLICCTLVEVLMMNDAAGANAAQCVGVFDYSNGSDMLLAHSGVASLESLRGGRIGLEPESVDGLAVHLALKSVGLTIKDVTLVPLAQSEMVEALRSGKVDAVQTYPPGSDVIERIPGVHSLWDTSHAPGVILDVLAAHQSFLAEQPHAVRGLLRAYQRAQHFYREQPQEALAILARRCRLDKQAMVRFLGGMKTLAGDDPETRRIFQAEGSHEVTARIAEGLVATGMLRQPPRQSPFDGRFVEPPSP